MFKNTKIVLMVLFLLISPYACDKFSVYNPVSPSPPKYVDVEVKYLRVNDTPNCPVLRPNNKDVLLKGDLPVGEFPSNRMQEVEENLFFIKVVNVTVNYPFSTNNKAYAVLVLDNAFILDFTSDPSCATRAHIMWVNGKLITKLKSGGNVREYALIRIDEYGNVYEVDK